MTTLSRLTGQVLDEKYRIDKQLGEGGMGAVFLATHLGTERPVALKVIAPQFMRNDEFVERFRREAKAAGRLQHPNVVDVTDFGFARVDGDRLAYLVMEYLDGCALSDVLAEESQLPIEWVVDILEQTCSAVEEAHKHGTIHRDLKPDNIWLEPNRRGGYTVKVLDFGLAKLADAPAPDSGNSSEPAGAASKPGGSSVQTSNAPAAAVTHAQAALLEAATQIRPVEDDKTQILIQQSADAPYGPDAATGAAIREEEATRIMKHDTVGELRARDTAAADGLTRVGSILGTPLYMSPEQCRGEALDARSDIYSLAVIAYQMLVGHTPFSGDVNEVIRQHIEEPPPPLRKKRRQVPKRMAALAMSALTKNPADRPASAAGFASGLRATSEGTGRLLRRAFALYSEHFPPFFRLALLVFLPVIAITLVQLAIAILRRRAVIPPLAGKITDVALSVVSVPVSFVANVVIVGMTIRLVTQLYLAPLRAVQLRPVFKALRNRLRPLLLSTLLVLVLIVVGLCLLLIPGLILLIHVPLVGAVVMMEDKKGWAAIRRSFQLVRRSRPTVIAILFIQYVIPFLAGSVVLGLIVAAFKLSQPGQLPSGTQELVSKVASGVTMMLNVFIVPLMATLTALLYLKTRQAGGETLNEALSQLEEEDVPRTQWQMRMRERTTPSGEPGAPSS
ncbi:MAG TPA: serine/threonine-protein kinase [Blastocatellia bacterium]|nr:serine/threonine-protein kinase [Blastocatellia bacterium]